MTVFLHHESQQCYISNHSSTVTSPPNTAWKGPMWLHFPISRSLTQLYLLSPLCHLRHHIQVLEIKYWHFWGILFCSNRGTLGSMWRIFLSSFPLNMLLVFFFFSYSARWRKRKVWILIGHFPQHLCCGRFWRAVRIFLTVTWAASFKLSL
jgi:hypothetical protein